jgi:hypothetical protein
MIGMLCFGRVIIRFRRFDALFLVGDGRSVIRSAVAAYESGLQVKGKLIPAENRGIISHWAAAQTLCRQAADARRGTADCGEYREVAGATSQRLKQPLP